LNEEFVKKEKVGANEASTKTIFILTQKKFEFKSGKDKIKDICNYCGVSI
jgi:nucleoid DNA-binding protein